MDHTTPNLVAFASQVAQVAWPIRHITRKKMEIMQVVWGLSKAQKDLYTEALKDGWLQYNLADRRKHKAAGTIPHDVIDRAHEKIRMHAGLN